MKAAHRIFLLPLALLGASLVMAYGDRVTSVSLLLMVILPWATIGFRRSCITATTRFIIDGLPSGLATLQDIAQQHFPSFFCLFQFGTFHVVPSPADSMLLDTTVPPSRPLPPLPTPKPKRPPMVSIKNHPQKELIATIAQALFESETKALQDAKHARDFLLQAKNLFESTSSNLVISLRTPPPTTSMATAATTAVHHGTKVSDAPTQGKPSMTTARNDTPLSYVAVTSSPAKSKPAKLAMKATNKGTRPTRLYSRVPMDAHDSLLAIRQDNNALYQSIKNTIALSPSR